LLSGITVCVADAAAYFTNVDAARCKQNAVERILECESLGYSKVFFSSKNKRQSKLGTDSYRPPAGWVAMPFGELRHGLDFFCGDTIFRAGDLCVRRLGGLPMGGALSPPLASFDLEKSILDGLLVSKMLSRRSISKKKESPFRIFQCRIYVDDIVCCSHALCGQCLQSLLRDLVPSDVGLEVEHLSTGSAEFSYLHAVIQTRVPTLDDPSFFAVRPLLHNERFAFGLDSHPKVAKLCLFIGRGSCAYSDLRPFVFARLFTFETTFKTENPCVEHVATHSQRSLACLTLEVLRLRWPLRWFSNILCEFPFYRRNWFASFVRVLGHALRRNRLLEVWNLDESAYFFAFDAVTLVTQIVAHTWSTSSVTSDW
jgi:hypothetical protein